MKRALILLALMVLAGFLAWALGSVHREAEGDPEARMAVTPSGRPVSTVVGSIAAASARDPASEPAPLSVDPDRRALAQPGGSGAPGGMADTIRYPIAPKLTDRSLSTIPHDVIGAWDDSAAPHTLGSRRAFILVVPPDLSDRELADLARDVRDSHLDAEWLTLRVFDSQAAATRPSWTDGGEIRRRHLVAELRRNTAGPGEQLEVRGREVDL